MIGYGEYILEKDPYNFQTFEEYLKHYYPDEWEEIEREKQNECIARGNYSKK